MIISISAHVPMSPQVRTSLSDGRSVIKDAEKVWSWLMRDADWDSG